MGASEGYYSLNAEKLFCSGWKKQQIVMFFIMLEMRGSDDSDGLNVVISGIRLGLL